MDSPRTVTLNSERQGADGVVKHDGVSQTTNQHGITTMQAVEKTYINEGNLYRLIVRSHRQRSASNAGAVNVVLPAIREHGL